MYAIIGSYKGKSEETIDHAETEEEAGFLAQEYQIAFGPDWSIWVHYDSEESQ